MARALSAVMNLKHLSKTSRPPILAREVLPAIWVASLCSALPIEGLVAVSTGFAAAGAGGVVAGAPLVAAAAAAAGTVAVAPFRLMPVASGSPSSEGSMVGRAWPLRRMSKAWDA